MQMQDKSGFEKWNQMGEKELIKKKEENNITQKMKPIELMWYKLSIDKASVGRIEDLYSESGRYCLEKLQKDTKS